MVVYRLLQKDPNTHHALHLTHIQKEIQKSPQYFFKKYKKYQQQKNIKDVAASRKSNSKASTKQKNASPPADLEEISFANLEDATEDHQELDNNSSSMFWGSVQGKTTVESSNAKARKFVSKDK